MTKRIIGKIFRITVGLLFLLAGLISGFLPGLQGWFFALIGLAILSIDVPAVRRMRDRFLARHPRLAAAVERSKLRWRARWRRLRSPFARKRRSDSSVDHVPPRPPRPAGDPMD